MLPLPTEVAYLGENEHFYGPTTSYVPLEAINCSTKLGSRVHSVQDLCESRGGRPGLSVLMSLLVSVDVKHY